MKAPAPQESPGHLQGTAASWARGNHTNDLKDQGAWEMVHEVKILPQKHEDSVWIPSTHIKADTVAHVGSPSLDSTGIE